MGLARLIARKSLLGRPARTLFSILGIALGIAAAVAVRTLDHNTIEGLRLRYTQDWRPELEVRPAPGVLDPRRELESLEGVAGASPFFQSEAVASLEGAPPAAGRGRRAAAQPKASASMHVRLIAVDAQALLGMGAHRIVAGGELDPDAREPEVLVGEPLARALGLEPGASLFLARPARAPRLACVDGVMQEMEPGAGETPRTMRFHVAGILARERLGRRAEGELVVVDQRHGRELYAGARIDERWWVRPDPRVDIERLQASLARSFAYDIGRSVLVGEAADERAFRQGVFLAGLLALALGLFVIFHTLSIALVERVREIGTLHALGATRAQIGRAVLLEALCFAGAGGALGLALGIAVARALLARGLTTLGSGREIAGFGVPWSEVLAIAGLGILIALAGSIFPLVRARGASAALALRGEESLERGSARGFQLFAALLVGAILPALYFTIVPAVGQPTRALVGVLLIGVGLFSLIVIVPLAVPAVVRPLCRGAAPLMRALHPFSGRMAAEAMLGDARRIAVGVAALTLVTGAFVGLKGMTASLGGEIEQWAEEAIEHKLYLSQLPELAFEPLRASLRELPEVLGVEPGGARTFSPFLLVGLPASELAAYGPLERDPALLARFERGEGLIASRRLAQSLGYGLGSRVQLATGGGVRQLEVLAISDAYGYFPEPDERMYAVLSASAMQRLYCLDSETVERVALRFEPGADPTRALEVVRASLGGEASPRVQSGRELRDLHLADIDDDFLLFDLILGLCALLAGVGLLNAQLLAALERTKELGILRALGASRRQIAGAVLLESAFVGLVGGALGALLGLGLAPLIVAALERLSGLDLTARGPGHWLWLAFGAALALSLLAALYPIHRMNRGSPARAVRAS